MNGIAQNKRKIILLASSLVLLAFGIVIIPKYFFLTEADLIKKQINKGANAVEDKDTNALGQIISEDYTGVYENSKSEALKQADSDFRRFNDISIKIENLKIEFNTDDSEAFVVCEFFISGYFTGSGIYNKIPFKGIAYPDGKKPDRAELKFKKDEDGIWRIFEANLYIPGLRR